MGVVISAVVGLCLAAAASFGVYAAATPSSSPAPAPAVQYGTRS
ncbi:MAG: hypothetical protein ABJA87_07145 [bacterium]